VALSRAASSFSTSLHDSALPGALKGAGTAVLEEGGPLAVNGASAASPKLADLLRPYTENARDTHPWREWAEFTGDQRMPGAKSRWTQKGKDLSWVPIRIELTCEVSYDHMQGNRFRHGTHFQSWRPDKPPAPGRTMPEFQPNMSREQFEATGMKTARPKLMYTSRRGRRSKW